MVSPIFDVKVEGAEAVIRNLAEINTKGTNLAPAFAKIADTMIKSHQLNFRSEGTVFGTKWPARRYVYRWPILHKTGTLSRNFKSSSTSTSATVTNDTPYAKYHQLGTRKLPVRGIVGLAGDGGKTDINEAIQIIRKHLGV